MKRLLSLFILLFVFVVIIQTLERPARETIMFFRSIQLFALHRLKRNYRCTQKERNTLHHRLDRHFIARSNRLLTTRYFFVIC